MLKVKLLPEEKKAIEDRGTTNVQAYKYFLLARQLVLGGNHSTHSLQMIVRIYQRCVELDPGYAEAWAMMTRTQERMRFLGMADQDGYEALARALALNGRLPVALAVKGAIATREERYEDAEHDCRLALSLDPEQYESNIVMASLLFRLGRLREAAEFYQLASDSSETECQAPGMLGAVYTALGDMEAAKHAARRTVERAEKIVARDPAIAPP